MVDQGVEIYISLKKFNEAKELHRKHGNKNVPYLNP